MLIGKCGRRTAKPRVKPRGFGSSSGEWSGASRVCGMDVELLTAEQVASILQVAPKTVKRIGIAAVRIGDGKRPRYRYRQQDVENYIQSHIQINQSGVIGGYRKAPREKRATVSVQGLPTWEDAKRAVAANDRGSRRG